MPSLILPRPQGFRLAAHATFFREFEPGHGMAAASADDATLTFAFRLDDTFEGVAARLTESGDALQVEYAGTGNTGGLITQLKRMLGLDADAAQWLALGARDEVVGRLQAQFPGFFTAGFPSPYEAGAGGIIAQRVSSTQATTMRRRLSMALGEHVELAGQTHLVFPSPERLLTCSAALGLPQQKVTALHALARAAMDGRVSALRLRAMASQHALEHLQTIHGVGPWTAGHMLHRGAAPQDGCPTSEPRLLRAAARATGRTAPLEDQDFLALAQAWRPFRMWVCILLMRNLSALGEWAPVAGESERRGKRSTAQLRAQF